MPDWSFTSGERLFGGPNRYQHGHSSNLFKRINVQGGSDKPTYVYVLIDEFENEEIQGHLAENVKSEVFNAESMFVSKLNNNF